MLMRDKVSFTVDELLSITTATSSKYRRHTLSVSLA